MKSMIFISCVLLLFGIKNNPEILQHPFTSTFEGKINNKLNIIAQLESKNGLVTGQYRYEGMTESLVLVGKFYNGDSLDLKEFNSKGAHTGTFKGLYTNAKISGTWMNVARTKTMPFYLEESYADYDYINVAGNYGNMEIKTLSYSSIRVTVNMAGKLCEVGDVTGDFKSIGNYEYKGTFPNYADEATFILKYSNKEMNLTQTPGEEPFFGGAHCQLEGAYKKQ